MFVRGYLPPSMSFVCGSHDHTCNINVSPILGPAAPMHEEHLHHAQGHQEHDRSERKGEGVFEGVCEPAVVARRNDHDFGFPEGVDKLCFALGRALSTGCWGLTLLVILSTLQERV